MLWRPSQWLCPVFLAVFEGSCFSGCPGQGWLRECLEVPNMCVFDSLDGYILKCCSSCFLSYFLAALGYTLLFDLWQQKKTSLTLNIWGLKACEFHVIHRIPTRLGAQLCPLKHYVPCSSCSDVASTLHLMALTNVSGEKLGSPMRNIQELQYLQYRDKRTGIQEV